MDIVQKESHVISGMTAWYTETCKNPSYKCWHPPVCQDYKSKTGCIFGRKCFFRHVEADGQPSKKSKKGGAKGSVAFLMEVCTLGLCVSRFLSEKIYSMERWKIGIKTRRQILQGLRAPKKKIGKERVHLEELFQSVRLMSVVLARQISERDHMRRLCTEERWTAQSSMGLREKYFQAQGCGRNYDLLSY